MKKISKMKKKKRMKQHQLGMTKALELLQSRFLQNSLDVSFSYMLLVALQ